MRGQCRSPEKQTQHDGERAQGQWPKVSPQPKPRLANPPSDITETLFEHHAKENRQQSRNPHQHRDGNPVAPHKAKLENPEPQPRRGDDSCDIQTHFPLWCAPIHARCGRRRPELRHAGPNDVNREAELERPSRVACSDLLDHWLVIMQSFFLSATGLPQTTVSVEN